jgi:3-hydroxy acid dehydrogenase/malonic semialdehyde reductase
LFHVWREGGGRRCFVNWESSGVALGGMSPVGDLEEQDIETTFATNFHGLVSLTQGIIRIFNTRSPPTGTIININSIAGREPYPGGSIYCASKAAVSSFSSALRKELIGTRIRVLEVAPGQVETEFSVTRFGGDRKKAGEVYRGVEPLTPEDVAEVVVWMVGRRENVVVADCLMFPNHQVSLLDVFLGTSGILTDGTG